MLTYIAVFDSGVNALMERNATSVAEFIAFWISRIFDVEILLGVVVILAVYFVFRKKWKNSAILLLSVGVTALIVSFLKEFFMRTRPGNAFEVIVNDPSFPSGHASISAAFFLALAAILAPRIISRKKREWFIGGSVTLIGLIGLSRVVLNVHWASDVIAGWLIGAVITLVVVYVARIS